MGGLPYNLCQRHRFPALLTTRLISPVWCIHFHRHPSRSDHIIHEGVRIDTPFSVISTRLYWRILQGNVFIRAHPSLSLQAASDIHTCKAGGQGNAHPRTTTQAPARTTPARTPEIRAEVGETIARTWPCTRLGKQAWVPRACSSRPDIQARIDVHRGAPAAIYM